MKRPKFIKKIKPLLKLSEFPPIVSVLRLHGVIGQVGPSKKGLTLESLDEDIQKAFSYSRLKAVVLDINSPGGSPVQSSLIYRRIREHAEKKKVPVYSFASEVAASGGYWLACAGEEIYAEDASIVGSIGVVSSGFGLEGLIKKLGIERRIHTAGKSKSILDPFKKETAEDIAHLKSLQQSIHDSFVELVENARKDKLNQEIKNEIFSGAFWTGRQAVDMGLVDKIGELHIVMKEKFGDNVDIRIVNPAKKTKAWQVFSSKQEQQLMFAKNILHVVEEEILWDKFRL